MDAFVLVACPESVLLDSAVRAAARASGCAWGADVGWHVRGRRVARSRPRAQEYYKPLVTPFELAVALSRSEAWTTEFRTAFDDVVPMLDGPSRAPRACRGERRR